MKKRRRIIGKMHVAPPDLPASDTSPPQCDPDQRPVDSGAPDQRKVLSSLNYNRNLLRYLNEDRQRQASFCDLVIVVEGKEFQVHKVVVAVGSSYFHACLTKNPNTDVVTLEHVNSATFQHLLNFLYTSEISLLETEVKLVLEAARFLDILDAVKLLAAESDSLPPAASQPPPSDETAQKSDSLPPALSQPPPSDETAQKSDSLPPVDSQSPPIDETTPKSDSLPPVDSQSSPIDETAPKSDSLPPADSQPPPSNETAQKSDSSPPADSQPPPSDRTTHSGHKCPVCERSFCYKKTLENHMDRAHRPEKTDVPKDVDTSLRKSTRKRKRTEKFDEQDDAESDSGGSSTDPCKSSQERTDSEDYDSEVQEESTGAEESKAAEDHEQSAEESNASEDHEQSVEESHAADDHGQSAEEEDAGEVSGGDEGQSLGEREESEQKNENAGNFPEGLAPIVLQINNKRTLQCPKCEKTFDRFGKYESHTRVHTGEKPFQCDICNLRYSTKSNLTVHRKRHNNQTEIPRKDHKCPFCSKLHASRKTLVKHVKRFHAENAQEFVSIKRLKSEGWKCDICNKSFTRRPHLEEHMILHSQDKPFKCTYCDEQFKSRFKRLRHQEKYHLGPFPCDICGRQFNDSGNLRRHIEYTHCGKRKYSCFICGKSVRERTTLKEHLRIHSGEKPHLCSICGQNFRHGSSYRLHIRVHHDDKRYECEDCGKTFIRHDHLTKHKKIHSGEKAHQCEECGKCFGRRDHLTVHYRSVHLGEKIWQKYKATIHQCEVCKKVFKGKSSLDMHFRTHSGEKPYKCQICNQAFRIKKTLTKHMVIHSDARPFNCQHCSAAFKRKDKLKYHIDHVHSLKTEEEGAAEDSKFYPAAACQSSEADLCVPLTLVPVEIAESEGELETHAGSSVLPQDAGYQRPSDLAFLEKYTLTPQPATLLHPVRPEQIMEPREHSYLGSLLGLESQPSVQAVSSTDRQ